MDSFRTRTPDAGYGCGFVVGAMAGVILGWMAATAIGIQGAAKRLEADAAAWQRDRIKLKKVHDVLLEGLGKGGECVQTEIDDAFRALAESPTETPHAKGFELMLRGSRSLCTMALAAESIQPNHELANAIKETARDSLAEVGAELKSRSLVWSNVKRKCPKHLCDPAVRSRSPPD